MAEPQLLLQGRLVDEHAEPVERARAGVAGGAQQGGVERVVDEVGDEVLGVQHRRVERGSSSEPNPTEVALTISSAAASSAATSSPAAARGQRREGDDVGDLAARAVDDDDVGGAGVVEGGDDAARGCAGTEHGDVHPADVDAVGVQGG